MIYIEQRPPPDLAPWVACLWQISGASTGLCHRVLPDGCSDWLLDLQAARRHRAELQLVGLMRTAQVVPMHGAVEILGIRLRPGTLGALRLPAAGLLDTVVPADTVPGAPQLSPDQLAECPSFQRRAQLLASALREQLARQPPRPDPLVCQALAMWAPRCLSFARVAALARQLGVSERALERRFRSAVGWRLPATGGWRASAPCCACMPGGNGTGPSSRPPPASATSLTSCATSASSPGCHPRRGPPPRRALPDFFKTA